MPENFSQNTDFVFVAQAWVPASARTREMGW